MQQPIHEDTYSIWNQLCRRYRKRRLFRSLKIELKGYLWGLKINQIDLHRQNNNAWAEAMDFLRELPAPVLQALYRYAQENLALHGNVLHNQLWFFAVLISLFALPEVLFGTSLYESLTLWPFLAYLALCLIYFSWLVLMWLGRQHALELSCLIGTTMVQRGIFTADGR